MHSGLERFQLPIDKVHCLVTDGAANMVLAGDIADLIHLTCFVHSLQRVIETSIFSQRTVIDTIAKVRSVATHFSQSPKDMARLIEVQQKNTRIGEEPVQTNHDVKTRWNSTYDMLVRTKTLHTSLVMVSFEEDVDGRSIHALTALNWDVIKKLIALLKPFKIITRDMSFRSATSSQIIPTYLALKLYLRKSTAEYRELFV